MWYDHTHVNTSRLNFIGIEVETLAGDYMSLFCVELITLIHALNSGWLNVSYRKPSQAICQCMCPTETSVKGSLATKIYQITLW